MDDIFIYKDMKKLIMAVLSMKKENIDGIFMPMPDSFHIELKPEYNNMYKSQITYIVDFDDTLITIAFNLMKTKKNKYRGAKTGIHCSRFYI